MCVCVCVCRNYVCNFLWSHISLFLNCRLKLSFRLTDNLDGLCCVFFDAYFHSTAAIYAVFANLKIQNIQNLTCIVIHSKLNLFRITRGLYLLLSLSYFTFLRNAIKKRFENLFPKNYLSECSQYLENFHVWTKTLSRILFTRNFLSIN